MAKVLVVYATRTSATAEIAGLVAEGIRFSGNEADIVEVKEIKSEADFEGYDGYVFGSPTYHGEMLQSMKTMLFLAITSTVLLVAGQTTVVTSGRKGEPGR